MNGDLASNEKLLRALAADVSPGAHHAVVVCVPFPYLKQARDSLGGKHIGWGAQDVSNHRQGAFTGEVSAAMLRDFECSHVIVGHSERRQYHGESNDLVAQKAAIVIEHGMTPIVCVGETLAEREAERTEEIIGAQLETVLDRLGGDVGRAVVAYEPVWAIGTGRTATPEQAQTVHAMLRQRLKRLGSAAAAIPLLYGGSVKGDNAGSLFACPDIDGGLVGGAALNAREFTAICTA